MTAKSASQGAAGAPWHVAFRHRWPVEFYAASDAEARGGTCGALRDHGLWPCRGNPGAHARGRRPFGGHHRPGRPRLPPAPHGLPGRKVTGVGFDRDTLKQAGVEEAYAFAAVSSGDNSNILATRVARETFHVPHVVARIYDPGRAEIYQRLGIPTVAAVRWSADQVLRRILPEQHLAGDFREPSGRLVLAEVDLNPAGSATPISSIEKAAGIRIAYLTRFGEGMLPAAGTVLPGRRHRPRHAAAWTAAPRSATFSPKPPPRSPE